MIRTLFNRIAAVVENASLAVWLPCMDKIDRIGFNALAGVSAAMAAGGVLCENAAMLFLGGSLTAATVSGLDERARNAMRGPSFDQPC